MKENINDDQSEEEMINEPENDQNISNEENEKKEQKFEELINGKDENQLPFISKISSDSQINASDESEIKEKEKTKEIHNSSLYNIKDYLFFFTLMISSSMNFSYLYYPLIIIGIILNIFIGKNSEIKKSIKFILEIISLVYSLLLLIIRIVLLILAINENDFIIKNKDIFLDFGLCYLRKDDSIFYFIMTFLGESLVILVSLSSVIISRKFNRFSPENDTALMKNNFWTSRKFLLLNFIFILSFATFNHSYLTLFYTFFLQILLFLSSINIDTEILDKLSRLAFIILKHCIQIQIIFINIFNVPRLQENILHKDEIKDKEGNIKVFSIFTKIGINYAYNDNINYVWKEWIGYLAAIFSLLSLTFSLNNINMKELALLHKSSSISLIEAKTLLYKEEENIAKNNPGRKLTLLKRKVSKGFISVKNTFETIIEFITSPTFIIQFCRILSIFYIYLYPNFYSIGIFITLFFSSLFINVNKNKRLTLFLLAPMVTITINFYHLSNINGIFENFDDTRRKKYLNFALGKYEYSFLELYFHNLFFIFIMSLLYSFYNIVNKNTNKNSKINIKNDFSLNDDIEEPLLLNINEDNEDIIIYEKSNLNIKNLLLKFIFTHIDKITLIAMYFVSMRSINLIHLVLVIIFLIQILLPHKIQKMYKVILCLLQILFFIELFIHLLKAYYFENFNNSKDIMSFVLVYSDKITDNNMELSIFLVMYCFYLQYQFDNFPYLKRILKNKNITLENYLEEKFKNLPKTKYNIGYFNYYYFKYIYLDFNWIIFYYFLLL